MKTLANRLTDLRENMNWTKTAVAKKLGLKTVSTYANWEYGTREPDADMIAQIAKLYNVSTDFIITGVTKKAVSEPKNNLEQTFEETIEELKQEETLMFMKDGDIDAESARLVKLAMKNAIRMVDEMNRNKNKE